jgi:hypothetical protein
MNRAEFDLGFEITFNTQHGKNAMFIIMQEFLGDRHLNAIYDAIKAAKIKKAGKRG